MLKRTMQTVAMAVIAIVTSFALAATAHAADMTIRTTDDNPGGKLEFTQNGDIVKLCDTQADGWRAVGYVIKPNGSRQYMLAASGNGNCTTKRANQGSPYNLVEGTTYTFKVCLDKDNSNTSDDRFCRSAKMKA
ncbi:hypothetical protein FB566_2797 [Stackebrandtia endophytica]|uniref:Uncharacterized protein n=1 Tax=Stackebrandtia endophytica TaxID=1496996 RepID=A0A543AXG3_9ACTN|nr:hypothetical protein [Stackebrandtia endophytica]TQL77243.1 hypothetical protein FB566_2797 [Stackebrandtia endophytica]